MKLIAEISEGSLGISDQYEQLYSTYTLRKSARAILVNDQGMIAVQYLATYGFYKLPGGGLEQGESAIEAFTREVLEEVGCDCEIIGPLGIVIEYRNVTNLLHIAYGYVARVVGGIGELALEPDEQVSGTTTVWMMPAEALERLKSNEPKDIEERFITQREISFVEEYLNSRLGKF